MKRYSGYSGSLSDFAGDFGTTPDLQINYRLVGEWTRANFMMQRFPQKVNMAINLANREMVVKYRREVISNINNQGASLGWPISRSEKYRKFKEKYSNKSAQDHYQFFGVLLSNIKTFKKGIMGWTAGIKEGIPNPQMAALRKGKALTVSEYAGILEHGSTKQGIPARPLWTPSYRNIGGNRELIRLIRLQLRAQFPSTRLRLPRSPGAAGALSSM